MLASMLMGVAGVATAILIIAIGFRLIREAANRRRLIAEEQPLLVEQEILPSGGTSDSSASIVTHTATSNLSVTEHLSLVHG